MHPLGDEPPPEPTLFLPGIVSTSAAREYGITFASDLTEAYFTRRSGRQSPEIRVVRFADGAWGASELAPFSGRSDEAASLSADGARLLFTSRRPLPSSRDRSANLWEVERGESGWSEPRPLPGAVNEPRRELGEYVVGDEVGPYLVGGEVLLFASDLDPDWGDDLYVAERDDRGVFGEPRPLRLNTPADERSPVVSPDGRFLLFQAYRDADGLGQQDLYVAERTSYGWSSPRLLPAPVNGPGNEGWPAFSPDGRHFFFASDRDARPGLYSIYVVATEAAGITDGPSAPSSRP